MNDTSRDFFRSLKSAEKTAIADRCGIKRRYLDALIYDRKKLPSVMLASKLEAATGGRISREILRPDVDWKIMVGTY